jgi:hypothetical protein
MKSSTAQQARVEWEDLPPVHASKERPKSKQIIDVGAFRKLIARNFDGRPKEGDSK